ncbi:response regulator transcription factor [Streptomyces beijiangensis]|uniref:Response regulator transcription factor n=1 Tax=Streptomyces beijiangensis TaxID=163361 RepID=A0A939FG02_9ACTN|nr:response regulator transcription factor [Streptomyces beijiangensis]
MSQHTHSHTVEPSSEHTPSAGRALSPPPPPPPPPSANALALRVVIADDNPVVRAGLTALLDARDDIQVVAEAADGRQALTQAERHRPDVILLDVRMPGVDGISALPHLVGIAPVMMLTYSRESEIVQEALRLGAGGYLVHGEFTADQLVGAVRDIKSGRAHFSASAQDALLAHVRGTTGAVGLPEGLGAVYATGTPYGGTTRFPETSSQVQPVVAQSQQRFPHPVHNRRDFGLSSREVEVMNLIASGMNNQQVAATCFISEKTVKNHINRIFAKLQCLSRGEAIAVWLGATGSGGGRRG